MAVACAVARAVGIGVVGVGFDWPASSTVGSVCGLATARGVSAVLPRSGRLDTTRPMPAMTRMAATAQRMIRLVFDDVFIAFSRWREVIALRRLEWVRP